MLTINGLLPAELCHVTLLVSAGLLLLSRSPGSEDFKLTCQIAGF